MSKLYPNSGGKSRREIVIQAALKYIDMGFAPVPIPAKSKGPVLKGWQTLKLHPDDVEDLFGEDSNIGLIGGTHGGGLVCVDIDNDEALPLVDELLPTTQAVGGRRRTHRFYIVQEDLPTFRESDRQTRAAVIEYRAKGGQTLVYPSVHPEGAIYGEWAGPPAEVDAQQLARAVREIARLYNDAKYGPQAPPAAKQAHSEPQRGPQAAQGIESRAVAYLERVPAAVSGQGGHNQTLWAASCLVNGFDLDAATAHKLLANQYNHRCDPPWSDRELAHKIESAAKDGPPNKFRRGWLLDTERRQASAGHYAGPPEKWQTTTTGDESTEREAPPASRRKKIPAARPFPTDELPPAVADYVRGQARAIGCDEAFVAVQLLPALASAIGNTRRLQLKPGFSVPSILWCMIVAPSGTHKSPAFHAVMRWPQRRHQELARAHALLAAKAREAAEEWKKRPARQRGEKPPEPPPIQHTIVDDATTEAIATRQSVSPRGFLLAKDELSALFSGMNQYRSGGKGSDLQKYLELYEGRFWKIDRKGDPSTITVERASMSISGGVQPGVLQTAMGRGYFQSGFAARMFMVAPQRTPMRWTDATVNDQLLAGMDELFGRLYALDFRTNPDDPAGAGVPHDLPLSSEGQRVWVQFFNNLADMREVVGDEDVEAFYSKLIGAAGRLALIDHCIRCVTGGVDDEFRVGVESVRAGIALGEWFRHEGERVYLMFGVSEAQTRQDALIRWIIGKGGRVTARELAHSGIRRFQGDVGASHAALKELKAAGLGALEHPAPGPKGGQPPSATFTLADDWDTPENTQPPLALSPEGVSVTALQKIKDEWR